MPFYGPWLLLYLFGGLLVVLYLVDLGIEGLYRRRNRRRRELEGGSPDEEFSPGSFQVRERGSRTRARHLHRVQPGVDVGSRRGQMLPDWRSGDEWSPSDD